LDENGRVNKNGGKYEGLDRYEARKVILEDLKKLSLLEGSEDLKHNVGSCYRCGNTVEPIISAQWFVKMEPLSQEAIRVVQDGEIKFLPDRFSKIYINWMENVHDWCISRQLWWGHRIPAWYCGECGHINVSREDPTQCSRCGSKNIKQDEDVLDTWFSSALWPFSTLGWPDDTPELNYFYPTDVLVTGYDIIFFWVARMIFSGMEHRKKIPFHTVLIHGLIRDAEGRKMSKSLGNGIDPLEMVDRFGADALRFNLITGNSPGNDMRFYVERCEAMRNFANKIWNASRFVLMNLTIGKNRLPEKLELEDKWILSRMNRLISDVTENLDRYELGVAAQNIYDFICDSYCDWYIELTKSRITGGSEDQKTSAQQVLCYVLTETLKLLHPFMPFITEEIWQALPHEGEFLMTSAGPVRREDTNFPQEESAMEMVMDLIRGVRARRAEMNVPPSRKAKLLIVSKSGDIFRQGEAFLKRLAWSDEIELAAEPPADLRGMVSVATHEARAYIPLSQLVDLEQERQRIAKEKSKAEEECKRVEQKLSYPGFTAKGPAQVGEAERERLEKLRSLLSQLEESAEQLS
jgi:valyl-tRNA synthetase